MADGPQGLVHWPGIRSQCEADFTFSHGVTPSVCTIVVPAGIDASPAEHGTLTFEFGGTTIRFPDAKLVESSVAVTDRGQLLTLIIHDRRWKWAWGHLSGTYNTRLATGTIQPGRERSPRELFVRALEAMGETDYDISQVPIEPMPEVNWSMDVPSRSLADLADYFGMRVVLRLDNRVAIVSNGVGAQLPEGGYTEYAQMFDPPERPLDLLFTGGPSRFEVSYALEAVGEELGTKEVKPIDKLSYRPKRTKWEYEAIPSFANTRFEKGIDAYELAQRTVFRWYRIKEAIDSPRPPWGPPGYLDGPVDEIWQVLPIEAEMVETWVNAVGVKENKPAKVRGVRRNGEPNYQNTDKNNEFKSGAFTIIRDQGIVDFHDYVWRREGDKRKPAELVLRCAVSVRHHETRDWHRFGKLRRIGSHPTEPRVLKHDEVRLNHIGNPINLPECEKEAKWYLDLAEAEYRTKFPQQRTYDGLHAIELDGAIHQIHWHVGPPYAWTRVSRDNEFSLTCKAYAERRKDEKLNINWIDEQREAGRRIRAQKENPNPFEPLR